MQIPHDMLLVIDNPHTDDKLSNCYLKVLLSNFVLILKSNYIYVLLRVIFL